MANYNEYIADCPFCAGCADTEKYDPFDGYQGDNTVYRVKCRKCGAEVCGSNFADAVRKWNRRAAKLQMGSLYGDSVYKYSARDLEKAFTSESPITGLIEQIVKRMFEAYARESPEERSED